MVCGVRWLSEIAGKTNLNSTETALFRVPDYFNP